MRFSGGRWKSEEHLALLLSDLFNFAGYRVNTADIRCVLSSYAFSMFVGSATHSHFQNEEKVDYSFFV
jgi:hypothetical protein